MATLFDENLVVFGIVLLSVQNEVPDAEPECDPASVTAARSLWLDRVAASTELTIEVQDYIPFSA